MNTSPSNIINCSFHSNSSEKGGALFGTAELTGNLFVNNRMVPDNVLNDVESGSQPYDIVFSGGYNVYSANQTKYFDQSSDYRYTGLEPLLISLGNYGGKTQTMPINTLISNWEDIVKRVPRSISSERKTDQRGYSLPTSGMLCAGSVEMQKEDLLPSGVNEVKVEKTKVFFDSSENKIQIDIDKPCNIEIFNISGKKIESRRSQIGISSFYIDNYSPGLYFLRINKNVYKILKN